MSWKASWKFRICWWVPDAGNDDGKAGRRCGDLEEARSFAGKFIAENILRNWILKWKILIMGREVVKFR